MKIVFLATTAPDFDWIADYYLSVFPEGGPNAYQRLDQALSNLSANPRLGKAIARTSFRQYSIPRTPFTLVYQIGDNVIEILNIRDQRSKPLMLDDHGTTDE